MYCTHSRNFIGAALLSLLAWAPLSAITIVKLDLGSTSPDVIFDLSSGAGILHTRADGVSAQGDIQTNAKFLNFVKTAGIANIPAGASFSLSNIKADQPAAVFGGALVNQATKGGEFKLYDQSDVLILEGQLQDGVLTGPLGTPGSPGPSTGSLFTVNLGSFVLPAGGDPTIYNLLDPASAQLSMSFTNVTAEDGLTSGLLIDGDALQGFTADVTAQIEARPIPEPATWLMALFAVLAIAGMRRRH